MSELRNCGDCGAKPGEPHDTGCDVERCPRCGCQAIGCGCPRGLRRLPWSGEWPGSAECREYGFFSRWQAGRWTPCGPDDPGAEVDTNRLMSVCRWDAKRGRWVKSGGPTSDWFSDVLAFSRKFGHTVGSTPAVPDAATVDLRVSLIREEVGETLDAIVSGDLPGVADGIADSVYVLLGTAVAFGIDVRPVWDAVHESNLSKIGGPTRGDGKALKPPGWQPPDVAGILRRQGPVGGGTPAPPG